MTTPTSGPISIEDLRSEMTEGMPFNTSFTALRNDSQRTNNNLIAYLNYTHPEVTNIQISQSGDLVTITIFISPQLTKTTTINYRSVWDSLGWWTLGSITISSGQSSGTFNFIAPSSSDDYYIEITSNGLKYKGIGVSETRTIIGGGGLVKPD